MKDFLSIRKSIFSITVLAVYFFFTSGVAFKISGADSIDKLDLPYSLFLSGEETGAVGLFTEHDIACAKWLAGVKDKKTPIYTDINGFLVLAGHVEPYTQLQEVFSWQVEVLGLTKNQESYVFLTEWNWKNQKMVYHTGQAGLREKMDLPWKELEKKRIEFQSGEARVYR